MIATFLIVCSLAAAMAAPANPTDASLSALINPTPELLSELNNINNALTISQAAMAPGQTANMESSANLNLNLSSILNDLVMRIIRGLLERLSARRSAQPTPVQPTPVQPTPAQPFPATPMGTGAQRPRIFNPLSFLFPSGGNSMMSMMYPRMMTSMMEGIGELF